MVTVCLCHMLGLELAPYSFSIDNNYYIYLHRYHHYNVIVGMCACACVCELLMGGQWKPFDHGVRKD